MADLYPGKVYIGDKNGGGWSYLGETDGPLDFKFSPELPAGEPAWHPWPEGPITASVTVNFSERPAEFRRLVRSFLRLIRAAKRQAHQQKHAGPWSRCKACHPEQARRPLAVNGNEYRRRQSARKRRSRRA